MLLLLLLNSSRVGVGCGCAEPRAGQFVLKFSGAILAPDDVGEGFLAEYLAVLDHCLWLRCAKFALSVCPGRDGVDELLRATRRPRRGHSLAVQELLARCHLIRAQLSRASTRQIEVPLPIRVQSGRQVLDRPDPILNVIFRAHLLTVHMLAILAQVQDHTANSNSCLLAIDFFDVSIGLGPRFLREKLASL